MIFEEALIYELSQIAAFNNRVYPLNSPKANAKSGTPYVIFASSEGQMIKTLTDGYLRGKKQVITEINVIGEKYSQTKQLASEVIERIVDMEMRTIGDAGPYVEELTYRTPIEQYENQPDLYRSLIEVDFFIRE